MAKRRWYRRSLSIVAVVAAAACASGGGGGTTQAGGGGGVAVSVSNDLVPPETITVWMVPETGSRRRLGTVAPSGSSNFTFSPGARGMDHRLVAERSGGSDVQSNPFVLTGITRVSWSTSAPVVNLQRGQSP